MGVAILLISVGGVSFLAQPVRATQMTHVTLQVPVIVHIGQWVNESALLTDSSGNPISNVWITWYFNGQEQAAVLTSPAGVSGHDVANWQSPLGSNTVSVIFNGTATYAPTETQVMLDVLPPSTTTTQTTQTQNLPSGSITTVQPVTIEVSQIDALPLALAIVAAGVIIAIGIVFASRLRRQA